MEARYGEENRAEERRVAGRGGEREIRVRDAMQRRRLAAALHHLCSHRKGWRSNQTRLGMTHAAVAAAAAARYTTFIWFLSLWDRLAALLCLHELEPTPAIAANLFGS